MLANPSPHQQAIFQNLTAGQGHAIIVAVAGGGKTTTLIEGLSFLPPSRTLLCAFSNNDKDELTRRAPEHVKVMTAHGLGFAALTRHPDYRGTKLDKEKGWRLAHAVLSGTDHSNKDCALTVVKAASLAKANMIASRPMFVEMIGEYGLDSVDFDAETIAEYAAAAMRAAVDDKRTIDFDDMIWLPNVHGLSPPPYDHVFIDEAQDLSEAQRRLLVRACIPGGRIIAVGDPAQCIYGFRGADADSMDKIRVELNATSLPLSVSYRCAKSIVKLAQKFVPYIEAAPNAPQGTVADMHIADALDLIRPGDYVLSRSNSALARAYERLTHAGTPATIIGGDASAPLKKIIRKSRARTVADLTDWLVDYKVAELERLADRERARENMIDSVDTIVELSTGLSTVATLLEKIDEVFTKDALANTVALSTVHKAKGRERDNVFVLEETFGMWPGDEEDRIYYVAITRARHTLVRTTGLYPQKQAR